jgi:hypothetical protein
LEITASQRNLAGKQDVTRLLKNEVIEELTHRGLSVEGHVKVLKARLWAAVDSSYAKAPVMQSGDTSVQMNLHRIKQVLFHLIYIWDGKKLKYKGGRDVRSRIIKLFKESEKLQTLFNDDVAAAAAAEAALAAAAAAAEAALDDSTDGDVRMQGAGELPEDKPQPLFDDDAAIDAACFSSTFIFGLWKLLDTEIRLSVVPFEAWKDGDILPFFENFHFNVLQVMAAGKPQVFTLSLTLTLSLTFFRFRSTCCCSSSACFCTRSTTRIFSRLWRSPARGWTRRTSRW